MYRIYIAFLIAFVSANLIVKHFGAPGLWISSFLLIPFDFICRCIIHERHRGSLLVAILSALTVGAAVCTILINWDAINIALASVAGFSAAQVAAGMFYQNVKRSTNWFYKVNVSDLIAIVFDSIVFQLVAFSAAIPGITFGQIAIKFAGGLLWYYILFHKLKINRWITVKKKTCS